MALKLCLVFLTLCRSLYKRASDCMNRTNLWISFVMSWNVLYIFFSQKSCIFVKKTVHRAIGPISILSCSSRPREVLTCHDFNKGRDIFLSKQQQGYTKKNGSDEVQILKKIEVVSGSLQLSNLLSQFWWAKLAVSRANQFKRF